MKDHILVARDIVLNSTDFLLTAPDVTLSQEDKDDIISYRQSLRDVKKGDKELPTKPACYRMSRHTYYEIGKVLKYV